MPEGFVANAIIGLLSFLSSALMALVLLMLKKAEKTMSDTQQELTATKETVGDLSVQVARLDERLKYMDRRQNREPYSGEDKRHEY